MSMERDRPRRSGKERQTKSERKGPAVLGRQKMKSAEGRSRGKEK